MKRTPTLFLKVVVALIAIGVLAALIRFPQTEGRAANLDLVSIYADPVIIYMYIAAIPFFVALWQAFKLLSYVDKNMIFSQAAVKAVRNIKFSATAIVAFLAGAEAYLFLAQRGTDDSAGAVMMGVIVMFISIIMATGAAIFQKLLQNAVDMKSENDLTV